MLERRLTLAWKTGTSLMYYLGVYVHTFIPCRVSRKVQRGIAYLLPDFSQTFDSDMEDTHRAWVFPFAHLVLTIERSLSQHGKVCRHIMPLLLQLKGAHTTRVIPSAYVWLTIIRNL